MESSLELVSGTFFAALKDGDRAALEGIGVVRAFPRGAALMFEREPDERVMVLLTGRVKVSRIDRTGRELMLDIGDPGDVFGELAFVDGQPRIASVTALEPARALVMSSAAFQAYLGSHHGATLALTASITSRFREAQVKRGQFTSLDTMGRLAARFVELADRYGEQTDAGTAVALPITQEELATWTGASRAGVSQALQSMRDLGWIELSRRKLLLRDLDALRARAE
jgi:CRP/FNR family transcriptional regulator, cyclic AMP receptor protein